MLQCKPVVVVLGMMGWIPVSGVTWQALHYLEGFRRLGFDTYYVEDNGAWPYDPDQNTITAEPTYTVNYLRRTMDWWGVPDHWAYVASSEDGRVYGMSTEDLAALWQRADILINVTGCTVLREEHLSVPIRIFLETDPVLPQIEVAQGNAGTIEMLGAHTHHFTFGENYGAPDCLIPVGPFHYRPTRQPVILDWWRADGPTEPPSAPFTTITNWELTIKDVEWEGERYLWSKHREFLRFLDIPRRVDAPFRVALACEKLDIVEMWQSAGWQVVDAARIGGEIAPYHDFIESSAGEFTVAKEQYVRMRSGWFSDRSATYLAAGKPVVTQNTGFARFLPAGEGLFSFDSLQEAVGGIEDICRDYERHSRSARRIAAEYFRAETVLERLLAHVGFDIPRTKWPADHATATRKG